MPREYGRWTRTRVLTREEKSAIASVCEQFIADWLNPRFLPEVRPTPFSYPVDIFGKWRGSKYSFITRYRSGFADNAGEEFDSAFTRLDHLGEQYEDIRFDVMWHRHTGQWFCVHSAATLEQALGQIRSDRHLQPAI